MSIKESNVYNRLNKKIIKIYKFIILKICLYVRKKKRRLWVIFGDGVEGRWWRGSNLLLGNW